MAFAALIWGLMSPVCKFVVLGGQVNAVSLASFRLAGATILFWIVSLFFPTEPIEKSDKKQIFFAALFGIILNQMAFTVGVGYTSPADAAIITTITPIFTMILSALLLHEHITGKKSMGVLLSFLGAIILISNSHHASSAPGDNNLLGNLLCLGSQCCVAIYFVKFKSLMARYTPITLMKWMFLYATLTCLPFTFTELTNIPYASVPWQTWLGVFYVVGFATFISYICLAFAQGRLRPTAVSMYNYTQPIIATCIAILWGMDRFSWLKLLSILLIFLGVFLANSSTLSAKTFSRN